MAINKTSMRLYYLVFILFQMAYNGCLAQDAGGQIPEQCLKPPPGFPQNPPRCCDLPFPTEEMMMQFPQCIQSVPRPPPSMSPQNAASFRQAGACLETCVFNRLGFLKSGGKELDDEVMKEKLKMSVKVPWSTVVEAAADMCLSQSKEVKSDGSCSEAPMAFSHCFRRQLFINCPKEMWNSSNDCNMVKRQMEMCPHLPPPPPGPPAGGPQRRRY